MKAVARKIPLPVAALLMCAQGALPQTAKPLKIVDATVSQMEDGERLGPAALRAGETAFLSFEVENYKMDEKNGAVKLTAHVQAFDPHGTAITAPDEIVVGTSLSQEDKDWKPKMRSQIQIPPIAPAGVYTIRYDVADQQAKTKVSGETKFNVAGPTIAPASELVIRNLAFYRGQDDDAPLAVPAYRGGDMVWVKFDVTGYKYGEQNAIDVSYDVGVTTSEGKQLFSQENAAVEKSQAFYPQPWVPGIFNLTLKPGTTPGTYFVTITAHDAVGKQTATARAPFKVE
jgi:hypothetical protein